ncbi:P-type ATPase, cytoplasmic domain N [Pseudocohnilembus persalinus]|uniref:P-type Cu(+) transporter n=1 Tax=Pseudocohnilembus persalinus TaxID=266149 RepID=A0A0V0RAC7_PSEPJ|nr:P-type ATPase, cytoplasmic domain N [Pseudocohnilembus persalinus]|eukprot:KRX11210.1 P-type ATPase, cytoplasmic domain N [Pseudocohnilembus persalinus]
MENEIDHEQAQHSKFKITQNDLVEIQTQCEGRTFAEEVDLLEKMGGDEFLERELHTNFKQGLSCNERDIAGETPEQQKKNEGMPGEISDYDERERAFSSNRKKIAPPKGFCKLLFDALNDFTLKILIVAAIVSIIIEVSTSESHERAYSWIEGFAILVAVMVCSLVTAINDYQKEKQFQLLNKVADDRKTLTVIRNGIEAIIHQDFVMVGDIIKIVEGMEIPADGILIKASEVSTDESAMTGETDPIKKNTIKYCIQDRDAKIKEGIKNACGKHEVSSPFMNAGTKVLNGEGLMLVIIVGKKSSLGKIKDLLESNDDQETPLQQKLNKIAEDIGTFGLYSSIAIVLVLLVRFTIERIYEGTFDTGEHIAEILDYFIIGITVVVVAIPEGLPLAVTLSLAFSVKKMLKDQNLVRQLQACETMGGANNICSDKTGTLTKNVMTLKSWWNGETVIFDDLQNYDLDKYMGQQFKDLFLQSAAVNTSASLHPEEKGSKTETAVLKFLMKTPHDYRKIRQEYPEIHKIPFSSKRKRMSTIIEVNGKQRILVKGASELVLESCTNWINKETNQIQPIDAKQKQIILDAITGMANQALRTIVLAYKDLDGNVDLETKDQMGVYDIESKNLTLAAVFGIADVIRPEVPHAVQQCKGAGIKVRMVTGDNKDTARAIAIECGIITDGNSNDIVMEGAEFIKKTGGVICAHCKTKLCDCVRDAKQAVNGKKLRKDVIANGEEFDKIFPNLCVMARSRPEDKYALVCGLIERGNVVAVTGDGTNDAPALKKADVGFAMGIAGTEVARESADIILLDDNFKSIIKAVLWGRNIYDSIKKFLQFQLTVNVVAVSCTLIGAAIVKMEILTPIQMLWVNLIMDTFASLALATEPPSEELLQRKPHNRNEYIISKKMAKHIFGQSIFQIFVILLFLFAGEYFLPEWESQKFMDEIPEKLNDYLDNLSEEKRLTDEAYRYILRKPYAIMFHDEEMKTVTSGRFRSYSGFEKQYENVEHIFDVPSRHFTYIFNVFVLMQVFNFLNARKLKDEINVFEGITKNYLFGVILGIIIGAQILVVTFGGFSFHCFSYYGLNIQQWLICIAFAVVGNFLSILLKLVDEDKIFTCKVFNIKDSEDEEEETNGEKIKEAQEQQGETQQPPNLQNNKFSSDYNKNSDSKLINGNSKNKQYVKPHETDEQQVSDTYAAKQAPEDDLVNEQRDVQQAFQEQD